jgi:hypothetical protein
MTSLSTRFLGQPKLTKPIFKVDFREDLLLRGYHLVEIFAAYGELEGGL